MRPDLKGLLHFKSVFEEKYRNITVNKENTILEPIIKDAKEIIKSAYAGKPTIRVFAKRTKMGCTIYAKDYAKRPTIAYDEFGTGFYASGSYPGKLPTQNIRFVSGGKQRVTKGWVYYYPNKTTKVIHGGIKGWKLGKSFQIGNNANATMYRACKKIINNIKGGK